MVGNWDRFSPKNRYLFFQKIRENVPSVVLGSKSALEKKLEKYRRTDRNILLFFLLNLVTNVSFILETMMLCYLFFEIAGQNIQHV